MFLILLLMNTVLVYFLMSVLLSFCVSWVCGACAVDTLCGNDRGKILRTAGNYLLLIRFYLKILYLCPIAWQMALDG